MIPFDASLLTTEHVYLKACTTALGGSISVIDPTRSTDEQEVYKKIKMPMAVARKFNQLHGISRYIKPVLCAIAMYDGHAVTIERHPLGNRGKEENEGLFGMTQWKSETETNIDSVFLPTIADGQQWFTDGMFVYNFGNATTDNITNMTADGKFKAVPVDALKFSDLPTKEGDAGTIHHRTCLDFTAGDGTRATSPPIWKHLSTVGDRQMDRHSIEEEADAVNVDDEDCQFDRIDEYLAVNLGFALKAAKELSEVFGYDAMEPLALDELMIQLRTVNLPRTSKHIKRTFDTGMKFTHAVAWLVGLNANVDTLDSYKVLRSLLKYLTTKGVYHKTALSDVAVYHKDMKDVNLPLMTLDEALTTNTDLVPGSVIAPTRRTSKHTAVGTLYNAE